MKIAELNNLILTWGCLSKEGVAFLKEAAKIGNTLVLIPENRPFLYGLKHNSPLLKENNIPFIYCTDNMLGYLFYKKKIKKTLLFYKEETKNGFISLCGSLYAVLLSRLHGVSVNAFLGAKVNFDNADIDASTLGGKEFISRDGKKWIEPSRDEVISAEVL